jgi:hypothetical protein
MALVTSYSTLLASVANNLARSDLTADIPGFVQNFEERFLRQPRNFGKWMEASLNVTITAGVAAVPTDYLAARILYLNGQSQAPLKPMSLEALYIAYPRTSAGGTPKWFARDVGNFVFGPAASGGTLNGTYYAKPVVLRTFASDAAAHYLIVNAPDLLLYGALLDAQPFLKNESRIPVWAEFYRKAEADYRDLMKAQNISGGALQTLVA